MQPLNHVVTEPVVNYADPSMYDAGARVHEHRRRDRRQLEDIECGFVDRPERCLEPVRREELTRLPRLT